ncbi:hypothetical protein [Paludisphaera mucosa]|uniref:Pyridoxamine 5'-phosphate oxidase putative domain-containing protein n=1 Tax=Paludisphaera mucosa TaxID=3030827 RepID=A0ABT6FI95_9BACT|nr:hypothetical protein [Paludisphaera mucosa]MDG3007306.1 hypothetical protein [Paludisphaera mucosa]
MPKELLRIAADIRWLRTVIQPGQAGLATELFFEVAGRPFSLTLDTVPEKAFLHTLAHTRCLAVLQISSVERGWVEAGRFEIRINDDDDGAEANAMADQVEWGPADPGQFRTVAGVDRTDNRSWGSRVVVRRTSLHIDDPRLS